MATNLIVDGSSGNHFDESDDAEDGNIGVVFPRKPQDDAKQLVESQRRYNHAQ